MAKTLRENVSGACYMASLDYMANSSLVDYNSWVESPKGLKLAASLNKDVVLAEGIFSL